MVKKKKKDLEVEFKKSEVFWGGKKLTPDQVEYLKKQAFSHLFNGVIEDDFLVFHKSEKSFFIGSEKVGLSQLKQIKEHAKFIYFSSVFNLVLKEMKSVAYTKMFENSETANDLLAGKMMLYNIDVLSKKLKHLSEIEIPKNLKELDD